MTREDIIRMAREACLNTDLTAMGSGSLVFSEHCNGVSLTDLQAFARLIAEDCAKRCEAEFDNWDDERPLMFAAIAIREAYKP